MLDQHALNEFCENFYGYGEAHAPHWFISMEEGGGNSPEEVAARIGVWKVRGATELEDLGEYHRAIGVDKWFTSHPPIQKTWYASIRILLVLLGHLPTPELART
jgi:hypothetical protein